MGLFGKPSTPSVIPTPTPTPLTNPNTVAAPSVSNPVNSTPTPQIPNYLDPTLQSQGLNYDAMLAAFGLNATNQNNPYGSLTYTQDPTTGQYTASQSYNPTTQNILNQQQGAQGGAGKAANDIFSNVDYSGGAPDLGNMASGATKAQLDAYTAYNQPYYDKAYNSLDTQLRNQGLVPGMPSYDFQIKQLRDQQSNQQSAAAAQFEPQAFSQAQTQTMLPAALGGSYLQNASPGNIAQNLFNTPTAQANPANLASIFGSDLGAQTSTYGSQLGAGSNLNSVLASLFGTQVGGQNAINSALASEYGSQVGGIGNQNQANMANYNAQLSNWGNMLKGGASILAAPFTGGLSLGGLFGGNSSPGTQANGGWSTTTTPNYFG